MRFAHLGRIKPQFLRNLIEMNLQGIAWLWRAMASLGTARWLIGEDPQTLKLVTRHFISNRLQDTRVERAGDAITSVGAAVEKRFEMHRSDRAIAFHAGLYPHQHRMASAMTIEDFFAGECNFHRTAGYD